jgi:hypothetical protein
VALANLYPVYKREIKDMKIVSILLFASIVGFTVFIIIYVCVQGTE